MTDEPRFCADCGALCPPARWCYAIPTCFDCLPPPALLKVNMPRSWARVQDTVLKVLVADGERSALDLAIKLLTQEEPTMGDDPAYTEAALKLAVEDFFRGAPGSDGYENAKRTLDRYTEAVRATVQRRLTNPIKEPKP